MKHAEVLKTQSKRWKARYYFKLFASNGEQIAVSSRDDKLTYTEKHSVIETLESNFPDFEIIDKTKEW